MVKESRQRLTGARIVVALIAVWSGLVIHGGPAIANHQSYLHLVSLHSAYESEDFCVNSTGTAEPWRWSTTYNYATQALWSSAPSASEKWDSKGWDSAASQWRVWIVGHSSDSCQGLPAAQRAPIEMELWLEDDARDYCGYGAPADTSCAFADTPVIGPYGHTDYEYYYVYLYKPYAVGDVSADGGANFVYHQINHEVGHAFGMADGSGTCPDSVMHSVPYGCSVNRRFPSSADTTTLSNLTFNQ